jgi:hypothetical protein
MNSKVVLFLVWLVILVFLSGVFAGIPQLLNYQGMLKTSKGQFEDTTLSMNFAIYPDSQGTTSYGTKLSQLLR